MKVGFERAMGGPGSTRGFERAGILVEARCAWCGTVDLEPGQLVVHEGPGPDSLFEFSCPSCRRLNIHHLETAEVEVLADAGIPLAPGQAPFELLEHHDGDLITWDDLIDFHEQMGRRSTPLAILPTAPVDLAPGEQRDAA